MIPTLHPDTLAPPQGDFVSLNARLLALRSEQLELRRRGFTPDPNLSDAENSALAAAFQDRLRLMVREQLSILAALRKTSSGPAKQGGKRAKKVPLDLDALENSILE